MNLGKALSIPALFLLAACATTVDLRYAALPRPPLGPGSTPQAGSIGVLPFEDVRGWDPNVVARQFRMLTAEIPVTFAVDSKGLPDVATAVGDAVRMELGVRGFEVRSEPATPGWTWGQYRTAGAHQALSADRVVTGRVHYFQWLEPGFAGFAVQPLLPKAKAYVAIDVVVLDAGGNALWAGQAAAKVADESTFSPAAGRTLLAALREALQGVMDQADFAQALSPGPGPSPRAEARNDPE